ncbi:hypothetical protein D3C85_1194600 [compost metagenome]
MPVPVRHRRGENRGQHHRARHGDTVRRRQVAGVLEADNHDHHGKVEQPVNERNVDLPGFHLRGVNNTHRRQIAQTNRLARQGEDAGNNRL